MQSPAPLDFLMLQGATFSARWRSMTCPYPTKLECGVLVHKYTGAPVPDTDLSPEDFTGCTARMQARTTVDSPYVLFEWTTENLGFTLNAGGLGWIQADMSAADTAAQKYGLVPDPASGIWNNAIGQVEIVRPGGRVDRPYVLSFYLDPEGTR